MKTCLMRRLAGSLVGSALVVVGCSLQTQGTGDGTGAGGAGGMSGGVGMSGAAGGGNTGMLPGECGADDECVQKPNLLPFKQCLDYHCVNSSCVLNVRTFSSTSQNNGCDPVRCSGHCSGDDCTDLMIDSSSSNDGQPCTACAADTSKGQGCYCHGVNCDTCGDGALDAGEECDGSQFSHGTIDCKTHGYTADDGKEREFASGQVKCKTGCGDVDVTPCGKCGNMYVDSAAPDSEQCDVGAPASSATSCATFVPLIGGASPYNPNTPAPCVASTCKFDTSNPGDACRYCGDGSISDGEKCDPKAPTQVTCGDYVTTVTKGATTAYNPTTVVTCTDACTLDTNGEKQCHYCGDGQVTDAEKCDGTVGVPNGGNCVGYNDGTGRVYTSGLLTCAGDCLSVITTACGWCGDGKVLAKEVCDPGDTSPTCATYTASFKNPMLMTCTPTDPAPPCKTDCSGFTMDRKEDGSRYCYFDNIDSCCEGMPPSCGSGGGGGVGGGG